uniref:Uncharacterized protein n=1 Tax=Timema genevievae TaxID=629358 RepID=A0A7R9JSN5_TIMGE|nr:unnamed protein product [Timema genevievae]
MDKVVWAASLRKSIIIAVRVSHSSLVSSDRMKPSQLVDEVSDFDAKIEEQILDAKTKRVKDYKKTKMNKGIMVFEEFLKKLENTWKGKKIELSVGAYRSVASILLLLASLNNTNGVDRNDDICGNYNGRRLYLGLGERGFLTAKNVTSQLYSRLQFSDDNISSHEKCNLEIVTCPSCVISVTFRHLNLSHHCGGGNVVMDSPCRCDLVWLSEPSYEDVSKMPFCGLYSPLMTNNIVNMLTYRSLTRTLAVALMFSESHQHAFTLEYSSERNGSNSGILKSPYFPASYPRDLDTEYVITCQPETSSNCRVRVLFQDFQIATGSIMEVIQGLTSEQPVLETLHHPMIPVHSPRDKEHVIPINDGFYVSLRGIFGPASRIAIVYTAFNYMDTGGSTRAGAGSSWARVKLTLRLTPLIRTRQEAFPLCQGDVPHLEILVGCLLVVALRHCLEGLILLISAMIVLLYRLGARARQQRELQNQLRSISVMLDGALHDDQPPDDPPIYEAPPDYNEVIKVFIDPIESQRRKRKRQLHHKNGSRRSQSTPRKALRNASPSGSDHIPSTRTFLEVPQMSTDTSDDYATISTCGLLEVERNIVHLQPYNNIMSRSCQTTPIPDSPPPPYVASLCPVSMDLGCFGRVRSEGDLTTHVSRDNTSLHQNYNRMSVVGQSAQQSWLLYNGRDSGNHCLSEIVCITGPQANHTQIPDYPYNEACSGLNINPTQESSSSSMDSDDNETKNLNVREPVVVPLCKILMNAKDQAILADMYVVFQWDCCQLYNARH